MCAIISDLFIWAAEEKLPKAQTSVLSGTVMQHLGPWEHSKMLQF